MVRLTDRTKRQNEDGLSSLDARDKGCRSLGLYAGGVMLDFLSVCDVIESGSKTKGHSC